MGAGVTRSSGRVREFENWWYSDPESSKLVNCDDDRLLYIEFSIFSSFFLGPLWAENDRLESEKLFKNGFKQLLDR